MTKLTLSTVGFSRGEYDTRRKTRSIDVSADQHVDGFIRLLAIPKKADPLGDAFISIHPNDVPALIAALQDAAGITPVAAEVPAASNDDGYPDTAPALVGQALVGTPFIALNISINGQPFTAQAVAA